MPSIDQPPPPMTWRDMLIGAVVLVAVFILAVVSSGSFVKGAVSAAMLFAIRRSWRCSRCARGKIDSSKGRQRNRREANRWRMTVFGR